MKNKYVTKFLCITLVSTMMISGTVGVMAGTEEDPVAVETQAAETESEPAQEPTVEVTPEPTAEPTPEPTAEPTQEPTETPTVEPTATPTPTATPEPTVDPTETPDPDDADPENPVSAKDVSGVISLIDALNSGNLTKSQIEAARKAYNSLSAEEKALVNNYGILEDMEASYTGSDANVVDEGDSDGGNTGSDSDSGTSNGYVASEGTVVTYGTGATGGVSNLHAGKTFYLDQLKDTYKITFDDEFADLMDTIESEYKEKNKISSDTEILTRNWQDILAIYVLEQEQAGKKSFTLDKTAKSDLAAIFAEMNPVIRDKKNILKVSYQNLKIADYKKDHADLSKSENALLNKYTSNDCSLLCSTVTAAKGFIRENAGDDIAEERVDVLASALSLVGKVGYFWGGKSTTIGWDSSWGTAATVSAEGSKSSGTTKAYGLDCSGFVTWAFINGYDNKSAGNSIGDGTTDQWNSCDTINAQDAQAGDLVFQRGPEGGSNNHVGFLLGQTDDGDWIAVHCSSSQNGVTVGEAYSASFRYIRCPSVYPTKEEVIAQRESEAIETTEETLALSESESTDSKTSIKDKTDDVKSAVVVEEAAEDVASSK